MPKWIKDLIADVTSGRARKFLVGLTGLLTQIVPALALTGSAAHWTSVALAGLTAIGTYLVPNATAPVPNG